MVVFNSTFSICFVRFGGFSALQHNSYHEAPEIFSKAQSTLRITVLWKTSWYEYELVPLTHCITCLEADFIFQLTSVFPVKRCGFVVFHKIWKTPSSCPPDRVQWLHVSILTPGTRCGTHVSAVYTLAMFSAILQPLYRTESYWCAFFLSGQTDGWIAVLINGCMTKVFLCLFFSLPASLIPMKRSVNEEFQTIF